MNEAEIRESERDAVRDRVAKVLLTELNHPDNARRSQTSLDNPGFCIGCGAEADSCEPDARKLECEACGAHLVYGAEELLLTIS